MFACTRSTTYSLFALWLMCERSDPVKSEESRKVNVDSDFRNSRELSKQLRVPQYSTTSIVVRLRYLLDVK